MGWGFAGCHVCKDEPLVSTFAFYKKEFICLGCGRTYEFLSPISLGESDELQKISDERKKEWAENAGGKLLIGKFCREGCDKCSMGNDEYHPNHATEEEWAEHNKAVEWLTQRTGNDLSIYLRDTANV